MANIDHGMSVDEVDKLGRQLQNDYAARLRELAAQIDKLVTGVGQQWAGRDADTFRSWWPNKKQRLLAVAEDLHGYGQSALNNARDQLQASGGAMSSSGGPGGTPAPGAPVYGLDARSYEVTSAGAYGLGSVDNASQVTVTRLSDGTYRVEISSEASADFGIGIKKILSAGMSKRGQGWADVIPFDAELSVGTGAAYGVAFLADSPEAAAQLEAMLQGRASSISNRLLVSGGVDLDEMMSPENLARSGVQLESITLAYPGASVTGGGQFGPHQVDAAMERHNETTYNLLDGTVTDRTAWTFDGAGTGWNQDGFREEWTSEVTHDANGQVVSGSVEVVRQQLIDTRSGFEKAKDLALGPLADNSAQQVVTKVTTYDFDRAGAPAAVASAMDANDRIGLLNAAAPNAGGATVTSLSYTGHLDSATRGAIVVSSSTAYASSTLDSASYQLPGTSEVVPSTVPGSTANLATY